MALSAPCGGGKGPREALPSVGNRLELGWSMPLFATPQFADGFQRPAPRATEPRRMNNGHSHSTLAGGAHAGHAHAGHSHVHADASGDIRRLIVALAMIAALMVGEVVAGILAHSLAVLSDAAHMLTDAAALGLAIAAARLATPAGAWGDDLRPGAQRDPVCAGQRRDAARARAADRVLGGAPADLAGACAPGSRDRGRAGGRAGQRRRHPDPRGGQPREPQHRGLLPPHPDRHVRVPGHADGGDRDRAHGLRPRRPDRCAGGGRAAWRARARGC